MISRIKNILHNDDEYPLIKEHSAKINMFRPLFIVIAANPVKAVGIKNE
jgi:hypothetical protein